MLRHAWLSFVISLIMLLISSGCKTQPPRPATPIPDAQATFSRSIVAGNTSANHSIWWHTALTQELQKTLHTALNNNRRLQSAHTGIKVAQARLDRAEAERQPELSLGAQIGGQYDDNNDSSHRRSIGLDLDAPLDFFNRLEQVRDAAAYELAASKAAYQQARLQQVHDYLLAYVDAAEASQRIDLSQAQVASAETLLHLTELRFVQGLASSVDVLQQRAQLALLHQRRPTLRSDRRDALNRLQALSGATPLTLKEITAPDALPAIGDDFAVTTPIALTQNKPDLVSAHARLMASDKRYAESLTSHLPEFNFNASGISRVIAGDYSHLISSTLSATWNLFDGGNRDAIIRERQAELEIAGLDYLQQWLDAVAEVDTLLSRQAEQQQTLALSEKHLGVNEKLLLAARRRYEQGISDYLPVLAALRDLQQQQRDHLSDRVELLRIRIRLHTALGLPVHSYGS